MEIFLEFLRSITANMSKHTTSLIKSSSNKSKLLRKLVIKIGTTRHRTKVNLALWNTLWSFPFIKKGFKESTSRVEIIIKPIDDNAAIDIGTEILAEFILLTTMISTMCYSIYLRRSKYNNILTRQNDHEAKITSRIDYIEEKLSNLLDFKPKFKL